MHWENELRTGLIGHRERLLGIAVCMNPRVVGADGHDRQIHRLRRSNLAKQIRIRGVAAKDDPVAAAFDQISVVSAMHIRLHTRAPVLYFQSTHSRRSRLDRFVPSQFVNRPVALCSQKIAGAGGGNDGGRAILQFPQARPVQVIHMRVREQDQIRDREFRDAHRRLYQSLDAQRERSDLDSYAGTEYWIGQDRETVYANQDGAVPDPGSMDPFAGPSGRIWNARRRLYRTLSIFGKALPENRRSLKNKPRERVCLPRRGCKGSHQSTDLM